MNRPQSSEYNPFFQNYVNLVAQGAYLQLLRNNTTDVSAYFEQVTIDKQEFAYAEGKWSIKEVLLHIIDTERVMCNKAFVTARGATDPFYSMDIELYAANMHANSGA